MNPNRIGTLSEKKAICYFVEQGLDVFDSCQDTGPVDIITNSFLLTKSAYSIWIHIAWVVSVRIRTHHPYAESRR